MVAGATSAAIHAATGRLILGSFPADLRGRAMAVRQTGQPLGVAAAAVVLPGLAESSLAAPYAALAGGCLVAGLLVILLVRDPARPPLARGAPTGAPYRNWFLWRVHAASGLLIVPQWTIAVFAFEFLVGVRGWTIGAAGALLAITQLGGAAARLGAGVWSDRVRHRLGPMRAVALAIAAAMAILGVTALAESDLAVAALVAASILTVSPNGLAYTAVAERAGSAWAGRALGIQNTVQNLVGAVTGPALAAILVAGGAGAAAYGGTFAAIAVVPVVAALAIPVSAEPRAPARASPTGA
jgi:sugar phosphate permease